MSHKKKRTSLSMSHPGCFIGILIMVYYNHHTTGQFFIPYATGILLKSSPKFPDNARTTSSLCAYHRCVDSWQLKLGNSNLMAFPEIRRSLTHSPVEGKVVDIPLFTQFFNTSLALIIQKVGFSRRISVHEASTVSPSLLQSFPHTMGNMMENGYSS